MNKKSVIWAICVIVALMIVAAFGVLSLYSGDDGVGRSSGDGLDAAVASYPLLRAVPSDAAFVAAFDDFAEAVSIMNDSTKVLGSLIAGDESSAFGSFVCRLSGMDLGRLRNCDAIVSHHYSGSMVPMLLLGAGDSVVVSGILAVADSSGLSHKMLKLLDGTQVACFSQSEALMQASSRHIESGMSILDQSSFSRAAASGGGKPVLLFCHEYAYRLMRSVFVKPYLGRSAAIGDIAEWSALAIRSRSDKSLSMSGVLAVPDNAAADYANVFKKAVPGDSKAMEILPASTIFALSIPTDDINGFIDVYRRNLDASEKLSIRQISARRLADSIGISPERWAAALDIKEAVKADVAEEDGSAPIVMARIGRYNKDLLEKGLSGKSELRRPHTNLYAGFLSSLFGSLFSAGDEGVAVMRGDWLISGPESVVRTLFDSDSTKYVSLSIAGVQPASGGINMLAYYSLSQDPSGLDKIFTQSMAASLRRTMVGAASEYMTLTVEGNGLAFRAERTDMSKASAKMPVARDTSVSVPAGPFPVKNCGTGQTNLFGQSSNGALTLSEQDGKAIWSVPFKGKLCGNVAEIDYYNNGKIQFLFASGDKVYLMDRLGRMVSGFPVSLGKDVLLGPLAYDFLGNGAYRVIVVHKDGTVGMYDIHGKVLDGWRGIAPGQTIKALPELLEVEGTKYWVVRTSFSTMIYPLLGGESLVKLGGEKSFRPDAQLSAEGGKVRGMCLDGKERSIKLQ